MECKKIELNGQVYLVSENGDLSRLKSDGTWYSYSKTESNGYLIAAGKGLHVWVAMAFLNHKPDGHNLVVHHKDSNPKNNHVSNLEIITQSENILKKNVGRNSTFPYVGYCDKTNMYKITMKANGKIRYFGSYKKEANAIKVARVLIEMYRPELVDKIENF